MKARHCAAVLLLAATSSTFVSTAESGRSTSSPIERSPKILTEYLQTLDSPNAIALSIHPDIVADALSGQRYGRWSKLFWYTSLDEAKAAAKREHKPILSLRMLGNLTDEWSCANSRFFRVALYPDPAVNKLLRDNFILHWSSERPVPKVTIDMGDGRQIVRTTTGNSAHYVLDHNGIPLEAIPGLYAPREFVETLQRAHQLWSNLERLPSGKRANAIAEFHKRESERVQAKWQSVVSVTVLPGATLSATTDVAAALAKAQSAAIGKGMIEVPNLNELRLGPSASSITANMQQWRAIGQTMFGYGFVPTTRKAGDIVHPRGGLSKDGPLVILSEPSRKLFHTIRGTHGAQTKSNQQALEQFEGFIVADTTQNEFRLHQVIRDYFVAANGQTNFAELNKFIYSNVFHTPASDRWLGLVDDSSFTGLPNEGITVAEPAVN